MLFKDNQGNFEEAKNWLQLAIAHSRLIVDDEVKKTGVEKDTIYLLSNSYAAAYWLPMRKGDITQIEYDEISSEDDETKIKVITHKKTSKKYIQPTFFDDDTED